MSEKREVSRRLAMSLPLVGTLLTSDMAFAARNSDKTITFIARLRAKPGARQALHTVLSEQHPLFPGCLYFSTVHDRRNPDIFLTVEVWEDAESHDAAVKSAEMQKIISRSQPLLEAYEPIVDGDVLTIALSPITTHRR